MKKKIFFITLLLIPILISGCSYKIVKNDQINQNIPTTPTNELPSINEAIVDTPPVNEIADENNIEPSPEKTSNPVINSAPKPVAKEVEEETTQTSEPVVNSAPTPPVVSSEENFNSSFLLVLDKYIQNFEELNDFIEELKGLPENRISYMNEQITYINSLIARSPDAYFTEVFTTIKQLYQSDINLSNTYIDSFSKLQFSNQNFSINFLSNQKLAYANKFVSRQEFINNTEALKQLDDSWNDNFNLAVAQKEKFISSNREEDADVEPMVKQAITLLNSYNLPSIQYNPPSVYIQPIQTPTHIICYYQQYNNGLGQLDCY